MSICIYVTTNVARQKPWTNGFYASEEEKEEWWTQVIGSFSSRNSLNWIFLTSQLSVLMTIVQDRYSPVPSPVLCLNWSDCTLHLLIIYYMFICTEAAPKQDAPTLSAYIL